MLYVIPMTTTKKILTKSIQSKWERNQSMSLKKSTKHKGRQQERKRQQSYRTDKTMNKIAVINFSLSIIPLNVNGLNSSIKTHRVAE